MKGYAMFPKELLDPPFENLSPEAMVLYTLMADRVFLSQRNGEQWEYNNQPFIYFSQKEMCQALRCSHDKATAVTKELQNVHLISRVKQGLGKPHRIFVNTALLHQDKTPSKKQNHRSPERDFSATNNTESINTELIQTNPPLPRDQRVVEAVIKTRINYDTLCADLNVAFLDSIIELMVDTMCSQSDTIIIGGTKRSLIEVCERFLTLDDLHVRYVYGVYAKNEAEVRSPRGFLLKLLYDAPWAAALA